VGGITVTITGIPAWFYTDQWFVDASEGWAVGQLVTDICDAVGAVGSHSLQKGGTPLNSEESVESQVSSGDTLALVEA